MKRAVTLLTDFGLTDPFVGVMKGVIFARAPDLSVIDLTHAIEPQNIEQAAFWVERCHRYFPAGTVHVVIVDPGVGSRRRALAVRVFDAYFLAPDNGVLGALLEPVARAEVRSIDVERLVGASISRTFHGRDLFAPLAAELAADRMTFESLGEPVLPVRLPEVVPRFSEHEVCGKVLTVDHFGNLISNITGAHVAACSGTSIEVAGQHCPIRASYSDVRPGELVALVNSWDNLEIAVRNGNAAARLGAGCGAAVVLRGAWRRDDASDKV